MKNYILFVALFACSLLKAQTVFRHTTATNNTSGHITTLDHPQLNGNPNAIVFILPNWNTGGAGAAGVNYLECPGVWYNGSRWTIFNQNTTKVLDHNLTFNVLIAPPNNPNYFTVSKTAENSENMANGFRINHPASNNKPNAFLLVTQNWANVYNDDNPIISYSNGKWNIGNARYMQYYNDNSKTQFVMKLGARFNVMVIENGTVPGFTNATAFLHIASASNIIPAGQHITFLENPSVNTDVNAVIFATPYWGHGDADRRDASQAGGPYNGSTVSAWYDHPNDGWNYKNNYWSLFNSSGEIMMPVGAKFHVVAVNVKNTPPPTNMLTGFVDMHTHPMSHLGFGGKLIHGAPDVGILVPAIPSGNGCRHYERAANINEALASCRSTHGGYGLFDNTCGDDLRKAILRGTESNLHARTGHHEEGAQGFPNFAGWPAQNDITHQQMWIDWVKRTYQNGLRVMVALTVNNATLAAAMSGPGDRNPDDVSSSNIQIDEMKKAKY